MKNKKGITLIALVITIIVLIILAGVSISVLLGENGIITRAMQAVEDYEKAAREEQETLNSVDFDKIIGEIIDENETKFIKVAAGSRDAYSFHKLALDEDGNVWSWGYNEYGQLGDGTNENKSNPEKIDINAKITEMSAGNTYNIVLDEEGNIWTWGSNWSGQLGDETTTNRSTPQKLELSTKFKKISAGNEQSLAIDKDGNIWSWGGNLNGILGDGTTTNRSTPQKLEITAKFKEISAGDGHSLALDEAGNIWSWGYNGQGQLGDGTKIGKATPQKLELTTKFKEISATSDYSLAIDEGGNIWSWGNNWYGQLGDGTEIEKTTPQKLESSTKFIKISTNQYYSFALDEAGNIWSWGENEYGQLGDGTTIDKATPQKLNLNFKVKEIATDRFSNLCIDENKDIYFIESIGAYNICNNENVVKIEANNIYQNASGTIYAVDKDNNIYEISRDEYEYLHWIEYCTNVDETDGFKFENGKLYETNSNTNEWEEISKYENSNNIELLIDTKLKGVYWQDENQKTIIYDITSGQFCDEWEDITEMVNIAAKEFTKININIKFVKEMYIDRSNGYDMYYLDEEGNVWVEELRQF